MIGKSNSESVYCANTTELVALKLVASERYADGHSTQENTRTREAQQSWQMLSAQGILGEGKPAQETLPLRQTVQGKSSQVRCRRAARLDKKRINKQHAQG